MKITFPHMGNAHIAIKAALKGLNLEVIPPPPITNRTMELGIKYSPEFACMPLKINVGNFIEALEKGADAIVMAGGWGPCRFGYFAQVERDILHDLGYEFDMYILEAPDSKFSDIFNQVKALGSNVSFYRAVKAVRFAWYKLSAVEKLEKALEYYLPRAMDKNTIEKLYDEGLKNIDAANSRQVIDKIVASNIKAMDSIPKNDERCLKIGLIGEIYTILEPSSNYDMVRLLGRLNVEVLRSIYISEWLNDHLLGGYVKKSNHKHILNSASPYLNHSVGGHGQETVGNAVNYARLGCDGLIQIGPLTCMPEIVAQSVLSKVSEMEGIPCMTLYFDEHSGSAGTTTRIEAFVDMLGRKKFISPAVSM